MGFEKDLLLFNYLLYLLTTVASCMCTLKLHFKCMNVMAFDIKESGILF